MHPGSAAIALPARQKPFQSILPAFAAKDKCTATPAPRRRKRAPQVPGWPKLLLRTITVPPPTPASLSDSPSTFPAQIHRTPRHKRDAPPPIVLVGASKVPGSPAPCPPPSPEFP